VFTRELDFYRSRDHLLESAPGGERLVEIDKPQDAELGFAALGAADAAQRAAAGRTALRRRRAAGGARRRAARRAARLAAAVRAERDALAAGLDAQPLAPAAVGAGGRDRPRRGAALGRRGLAPARGGGAGRRQRRPAALFNPELERDGRADPLGDAYLLSYADFLTPDTLFLARAGGDERELLKRRPAFFDASGLRAEQRFATSKDGTRVPYFLVGPKDLALDGDRPTLLYGYGGFELSLLPSYLAAVGPAWLARGGVYVLANLRGGGEYGPPWHQAAIRAHKQRSFDDFAAVAEDLIARRVTRPARLGIMGGSNGGLLVGATLLQRPELFNAVVCKVPLLDMRRYHRLLAGASWMAEYGDPDRPEQWAWIARYSPYQNVRAGRSYPVVLFTTSTRDDRVHPGHARKMAARMAAQGHTVLYYENIEGGHGGAADNAQRAHLQALEYAYLWRQLGDPPLADAPPAARG
jgi:prolyl oligopeptidase